MTLLTVIYDAAVDQSITALLDELDVSGWTKVSRVQGGGDAGLKLDNPIWPGSNNLIYLAGDEELVRSVACSIRELQSEFKLRPGIFMYFQRVEAV